MSKRASPTVVGTFVVAAVVLTLIAIVILGGGRVFHDTARMIVYFDRSVSGLRIGAPVKFRGIEVGTVKDIRINMSHALRDPQHIRIPVVIEIDIDRVSNEGVPIDLRDRAQVQALVDVGLRAELATESFVTGVRYVALDVRPDTTVVMVNDPAVPYPEIPSVPSPIEHLSQRLEEILTKLGEADLGKLVQTVQATADDARRLVGSPQLARAVARLDEITATMKHTVSQLEGTAVDMRPAITSARQLLAPDGRLSTQLDVTLRELTSAARSLRRLVDQIARDPGSIVRGGRP